MSKAKKYFSQKQKDEIAAQAISFWDDSTERMAQFFTLIDDYNRLYRVKLPKELEAEFEKDSERASMVPADIFNNVRSVQGHVDSLLFAEKPYLAVTIPGLPTVRNSKIDKAETLLSHLLDISDFKGEFKKAEKQTFIGGITALHTTWHTEYNRKVQRGADGKPKADDNGNYIFDYVRGESYPKCTGHDIRRVRIDPKAENFKDIRIVGTHYLSTKSTLLQKNADPTSHISFDVQALKDSAFPKGKYYEYAQEESRGLKDKMDSTIYGDDPVEVIEVRGLFQLDGKYIDLIVEIANRDAKLVIGARPNNLPIPGWKTFDFMRIDDEYNCMFPMGLIEPASDTFIEMFLKRNQAIDIANNQAYDMYVGDVAATADLPDKIVRKGGRIVRVNLAATGAPNVKSVFDTIQRSANPIDTFSQSEVCKSEAQQTMRRNDYVQSGDPSRKETATAVESMEGGAFRDMLQLMDYMNSTGLSPVGEKYLLYWDFFNGHKDIDIADTQNRMVTIGKGEMREPFKVSVDIAAALDRPHVIRRVVESMQMLREDETLDRYWLNKTFLWFLKYPNADRINPLPEVKIAAIERENIALKNGITQPVHPGDDHEMHIKIHMERSEADAKTGGFELSEAAREAYAQHLEAHQEFLEQQSGGSPNMTKLKAGPNNGQMIGGNSPKIKGTSP